MTSASSAAMPPPISPRTPAPPWYRQRWPWLLMAGPAIVVAASMVTLWLAATTDDAIVADDYYKRGLVDQRAAAAGGARLGAGHERRGRHRRPMATCASRSRRRRRRRKRTPRWSSSASHTPRAAGWIAAPSWSSDRKALTNGSIDPVGPGRWLVSLETQSWRLPAVAIAGDVRTLEIARGEPAEGRIDGGREGQRDEHRHRTSGAPADAGDLAGIPGRGRGRARLLLDLRPVRAAFLRRAAGHVAPSHLHMGFFGFWGLGIASSALTVFLEGGSGNPRTRPTSSGGGRG